MDVAIFVPLVESQAATEVARKVCAGCPVMEECRSFAVPIAELKGIWAGTSSADRKRLRTIGRDGAMSEVALEGVPEPSADELVVLDPELANEEPLAEPAPAPPTCVVCHHELEVERIRRRAVTCTNEDCQAEHRREHERQSKARLPRRGNGHVQPVGAPAVTAAPVAVALSDDAYPANGGGNHAGNGRGQVEDPQVPLEAVSAWLAALPPAVTAVELGTGWRLARTGATNR